MADLKAFATFQEQYVSKYIQLADAKATVVAGAAGALLSYLMAQDYFRQALSGPVSSFNGFIAWAAILSTAMAFLLAMFVITPRVGEARPGVVYFGAVAAHPSAEAYLDHLKTFEGASLEAEQLANCYELARICRKKFRVLLWALIAVAVAGLLSATNFYLLEL